jgi:hypothetical protein
MDNAADGTRCQAELEALPDTALLVEAEAAILARCSVSTLQKRRCSGTGPPYLKMPGGRLVRYTAGAVREWRGSNPVRSTSEAA